MTKLAAEALVLTIGSADALIILFVHACKVGRRRVEGDRPDSEGDR